MHQREKGLLKVQETEKWSRKEEKDVEAWVAGCYSEFGLK